MNLHKGSARWTLYSCVAKMWWWWSGKITYRHYLTPAICSQPSHGSSGSYAYRKMSEEGWSSCYSILFASFKSHRKHEKDLGAVFSGLSRSHTYNSVQIQTTRAQLRSFTTFTRVSHAVYLYCFKDLIYLCVGTCLRPQFLFRPGETLPRDRADGPIDNHQVTWYHYHYSTLPLTRHQGKYHKHDRSSSCPPRRTNNIAESGSELHSSNCVIGDFLSKPKGQLRPRRLHHWSLVFKSIDY